MEMITLFHPTSWGWGWSPSEGWEMTKWLRPKFLGPTSQKGPAGPGQYKKSRKFLKLGNGIYFTFKTHERRERCTAIKGRAPRLCSCEAKARRSSELVVFSPSMDPTLSPGAGLPNSQISAVPPCTVPRCQIFTSPWPPRPEGAG